MYTLASYSPLNASISTPIHTKWDKMAHSHGYIEEGLIIVKEL